MNQGTLDLPSNALILSHTPCIQKLRTKAKENAYLILTTSNKTRSEKFVFSIVHHRQRGHTDLNRGPLDLPSNALILSHTPCIQKLRTKAKEIAYLILTTSNKNRSEKFVFTFVHHRQRGHPDLNWETLHVYSNALLLSYTSCIQNKSKEITYLILTTSTASL